MGRFGWIAVGILLSIVLPVLMQMAFVWSIGPNPDTYEFVLMNLACLLLGFAVIAPRYTHRQKIMVGVVYFPVMLVVILAEFAYLSTRWYPDVP